MIVTLDPGTTNLGWAIAEDSGAILSLGYIGTTGGRELKTPSDLARRMVQFSREFTEIVEKHWVRRTRRENLHLIAEEMGLYGASQAIWANTLPWGAIAMMTITHDAWLHAVPPKAWQRAIIGGKATKKTYPVVIAALRGYCQARPALAAQLDAINITKQNHATDAVGIARYFAKGGDAQCVWHGPEAR